MTTLELASILCRQFEGFSPKPYLCPAQVWTIGYGSTRHPRGRKVQKTDAPITKGQAEAYLQHELYKCMVAVIKQCPVLLLDNKKLAATTDFVYNLGAGRLQTSTLRRRINQRDWVAARKELERWVYAGGRKLRGLVLRRQAEAAYFRG